MKYKIIHQERPWFNYSACGLKTRGLKIHILHIMIMIIIIIHNLYSALKLMYSAVLYNLRFLIMSVWKTETENRKRKILNLISKTKTIQTVILHMPQLKHNRRVRQRETTSQKATSLEKKLGALSLVSAKLGIEYEWCIFWKFITIVALYSSNVEETFISYCLSDSFLYRNECPYRNLPRNVF